VGFVLLFLHIGSQKTGTTAIQSFLRFNADLLRQAGFHYLKTGRAKINHNRMAASIKRGDGAKICADLAAEVTANPSEHYIISSELFLCPGCKSLKQALPTDLISDIRIICYLRRQDKFLEAMYKQRVKTGRAAPDRAAFLSARRDGLDYLRLIDEFAASFGERNIVVRPYERRHFANGDVVEDFAHTIGLDLAPGVISQTPQSNKTLSVEVSEMLGSVSRHTSFNVREIIREIIRLAPEGAIRSGDVYDRATARDLVTQHADGSEELRQRYCADIDQMFATDDLDGTARADDFSCEERLHQTQRAIEAVLQAIGNLEAAKIRLVSEH